MYANKINMKSAEKLVNNYFDALEKFSGKVDKHDSKTFKNIIGKFKMNNDDLVFNVTLNVTVHNHDNIEFSERKIVCRVTDEVAEKFKIITGRTLKDGYSDEYPYPFEYSITITDNDDAEEMIQDCIFHGLRRNINKYLSATSRIIREQRNEIEKLESIHNSLYR